MRWFTKENVALALSAVALVVAFAVAVTGLPAEWAVALLRTLVLGAFAALGVYGVPAP